ncbi:hypothetical protein CI109_106476 [Kwoniella shandongensis]|uniref:Uncharacterized protein n=1 Tax=Kwoniella shandongensis TaxID=1734106 RepID=A0A5M6C2G3_9TREE|nr:uncharacterized protein CI109_002658 [Kwoniella shandongensis]KAA5528901.1 hypothetical protein CI109_002658 [Kwoniella shandongensis]
MSTSTIIEPGHADPSSVSASITTNTNSKDTSYVTRLATPSDAASISYLIGSTWSKFFGYSVSPSDLEHYMTTKLSVDGIKRDLEDSKNVFLVATPSSSSSSSAPTSSSTHAGTDGEIVGVVQLVKDSTEPCLTLPRPIELQRLYAHSSTHGTGLGPLLISIAEQESRKMGYKSIWLGVWEDNARAKRFYEKMGFRAVGEHYFYVGESKRRDWIMEKSL